MAKEVSKEQAEKEQSLLKKLVPRWMRRVKADKKHFEPEPFPSDAALLEEQKKLVELEKRLNALLKPVKSSSRKKTVKENGKSKKR